MAASSSPFKVKLLDYIKDDLAEEIEDETLASEVMTYLNKLEGMHELDVIPALAKLLQTEAGKLLTQRDQGEFKDDLIELQRTLKASMERYAAIIFEAFNHVNKAAEQETSHPYPAKIEAFRCLMLLRTLYLSCGDQLYKLKEKYKSENLNLLHICYCNEINWYDLVKNLQGREIKYYLEATFSSLVAGAEGAFNPTGFRVLAHLEKMQRPDFHCYIIEAPFDHILKASRIRRNLDRLLSHPLSDKPYEVEFIVNMKGHHAMVHLYLTKDKKGYILFDAPNLMDTGLLIMELERTKGLKGNGIIIKKTGEAVQAGIQSDFESCPVFSYDHALQASLMKEIYQKFSELQKTKGGRLDWSCLPPQFVWNAQYKPFLDRYREQHPEINFDEPIHGGDSFNSRLKIAEPKEYENPLSHKKSICLDTPDKLFAQYHKIVMDYIRSLSDREVELLFRNYILTEVPVDVVSYSMFAKSAPPFGEYKSDERKKTQQEEAPASKTQIKPTPSQLEE